MWLATKSLTLKKLSIGFTIQTANITSASSKTLTAVVPPSRTIFRILGRMLFFMDVISTWSEKLGIILRHNSWICTDGAARADASIGSTCALIFSLGVFVKRRSIFWSRMSRTWKGPSASLRIETARTASEVS